METGVWQTRGQASAESRALGDATGLPEPLARLLLGRGLADVEAVRAFLQPTLAQLHDPRTMLGMDRAVERLRAGLAAGEPVLIYGDYDVDGTVATVLLKTAADRVAAMLGQTADVRYHIPHRIREGYGMLGSRIADAAAEGVRLIVSVDTGIRGFAAAEEARRVGVDLIVTDHHLPDEMGGLPDALVVLNPNQPGCGYPCKDLCGAAVAFKLAQALLESAAKDDAERLRLRERTLPSFLKLLAIATVADAVPLCGENRVIAALGLAALKDPRQPGLRALMELAGLEFGEGVERPISAGDVGFRLAPRINAAGRMDVGAEVVEMFLTRDGARARELAEKLHRLNDDRRASEAEALRTIEERLEAIAAAGGGWPGCLVLDDGWSGSGEGGKAEGEAGEGVRSAGRWHRGVTGILASRVVERTGCPALVIAHEADGLAYGSGRSVAGFHLLEALSHVHGGEGALDGGLFSRFGGHAHAVGFSLPSERVPRLRAALERFAAERDSGDRGITPVAYDADVRPGELTPDFLKALEWLEPFGQGNDEPLWRSSGLRIAAPLRVIAGRHVRLCVEDEDGARLQGVAWSRRTCWAEVAAAEGWKQGDGVDLLYRMRRNWRQEYAGWEMEIVEVRRSSR